MAIGKLFIILKSLNQRDNNKIELFQATNNLRLLLTTLTSRAIKPMPYPPS